MATTNSPKVVFESYEDLPEYIIKGNTNKEGESFYKVKWVGCDIEETTWETEAKIRKEWPWLLTDAKEKTYQTLNNSTDNSPVPYAKVIEYTSQVKNWDEEVSCIRYLEKASIPGYIVYVDWKNGYKSTHHSSEVYAKCPQKMIEFYEKYLVFTDILKEEIIDIVA